MANKFADLYFYRDSNGNEIDLIVDTGTLLLPVEIKSSSTYHPFFHIDNKASGFVIYAGDHNQRISGSQLVSWRALEHIFDRI